MNRFNPSALLWDIGVAIAVAATVLVVDYLPEPVLPRSEERRVGKEGIYQCDWSSDVCSSDLDESLQSIGSPVGHRCCDCRGRDGPRRRLSARARPTEIGRASCRERGYISV